MMNPPIRSPKNKTNQVTKYSDSFTFQLHNSANPWNSFAGYRREIHTFLWNAQPTQDFTNGAIYNEGKRCLNVGGVRGKKSEKSKNLLAVLCV